MNKPIAFILISLAFLTLFLPFQEFENPWANFDDSGAFLKDGNFNSNHVILGYELVFPIFYVVLVMLGTIFSGIVKADFGKTVGLVLGCLNVVLMIKLFYLVASRAESAANSMFRPPSPIIGVGFYLLLFTSVVALIYAVLRFSHK